MTRGRDSGCVEFLRWSLPRLRYRWEGFRRVRRQVCRRISSRFQDLGLTGFDEYRRHLESHAGEWDFLDSLCTVTITRFYRDRGIFRLLERNALPRLATQARERGEPCIRAWSAGCGSGEEPYTLAILWALAPDPALRHTGLEILATETDALLLQGIY